MLNTNDTALALIATSVVQNCIAHAEWAPDLADVLAVLSSDSAENGSEHEFWGTDDDGDEWRVHLHGRAAAQIAAANRQTAEYWHADSLRREARMAEIVRKLRGNAK
jgi:hypothetical protein